MDAVDASIQVEMVELSSLDLSTRTANCCENARLCTIGDLAHLRSVDILSWRHAGRKTLTEIRSVLGSVGLKLADDVEPIGQANPDLIAELLNRTVSPAIDEQPSVNLESAPVEIQEKLVTPVKNLAMSVRARNIVVRLEVKYLGELIQLSRTEILGVSNAGKTTLAELSGIVESHGFKLRTKIDGWTREAAAEISKHLRDAIGQAAKERSNRILSKAGAEPTSLEQELHRVLRAFVSDRDSAALTKLWGWGGDDPRVLESVGQEYTLTRERIRQIEKRAIERVSIHKFELPFLTSALKIVRHSVPDLEATISNELLKGGVVAGDFSVGGLKVAAEMFGLKWPFEFAPLPGKRMLVDNGDAEKLRRAIIVLRRRTSDRGVTSMVSLLAEVGLDESKIPALRQFLENAEAVAWLDAEKEWLFLPDGSRNRLINLASKVLSVCPVIRLAELRRAVGKSRRLAMVPSQKILGAFVERTGLGTVRDDVITATSMVHTIIPKDSVEGGMLQVLDEYGPVLDGEVFAAKCVSAGINPTSFYIYRLISPVICSLGKGVFCKVGCEVPPGTVEDILSRRKQTPRVADHGWTPAGRLWFGVELTLQTMTAGGMRLPTFVSDLVQGEWSVVLPDGTPCGSVTCRDIFIWSFRKAFALLGAEPNDLAAFEFDLKARQVHVCVGGPGLFEAIEDPDFSSDEASEDDD